MAPDLHDPVKRVDLSRSLIEALAGEGDVTNDELVTAFARHQRVRNLSKATTKRETLVVRSLGRAYDCPLLKIKRQEIEEWLDASPRSPRTRSTYVSYLSAFYTWANREGLTDRDPTKAIIRPKLRRGLPRPMPDADLRLAAQKADPRMHLWLCLGALEGLRVSEIAALAVEDFLVDADPPMLRVVHGKGDKERLVPLHPYTIRALRQFGPPKRGYLFPGVYLSRHLKPETVTKYMTRYLRELGIEHTPHSLRHWFGVETYRDSRDLRMVQELLGHADVATTQGYTAFSPGAATAVVQRLGERLYSRPPQALVWLTAFAATHFVRGSPW